MMVQLKAFESQPNQHTWRFLFTHAAQQIIETLPCPASCERFSAGYGWGLRNVDNRRQGLLLHPASVDVAETGDLALTVFGSGTHVIPRHHLDYVKYLDYVAEIVATTARMVLVP